MIENDVQKEYTYRSLLLIVLSLILITLLPFTVIASDVTNADWIGTVRVTNNSTAASIIAVPFILDTDDLISGNYTLPTLVDTCMRTNAAADTYYMPATTGTGNWCVYVPSIIASGQLNYKLYLGGGVDMAGDIRYFPGATGMLVTDNANMEIGDLEYRISIYDLYLDVSAGSIDSDIIVKANALRLYVKAANQLEFIMYDGASNKSFTAAITSGQYDSLELIRPNGTSNVSLYLDGNLVGTGDPGASQHVGNASHWYYCDAPAILFASSVSHNVTGTNYGYWEWGFGNTFTDESGSGNTATPTFRTTSTDADVSAELISFIPYSYSVASGWSTSNYSSMASLLSTPTGLYDELNVAHIPGDEIISDIFATSSTPISIFWFTLPFLLMVIFGFVVYKMAPSLLTQWIVMFLIIIGFATMGPVPLWAAFVFAIDGIAIVVASKAYGW